MTKAALIFPGQGAQSVGMGKDLYESSAEAKSIIDQADTILGNGLKDVMFDGPAEKLMLTAYTQPAIFTMSMAALAAFRASDKYKNVQPVFAAGLSLGEYSALCACGILSFEETLKLIKKRSEYMEEATKIESGKMAAIIGLDKEKISDICNQAGAQVANFNSPQQIVITGYAEKVVAACKLLEEAGAKSVIPLDVSGAFHSSLMQTAADKFAAELEPVAFTAPEFPLVGNVDGKPTTDPDTIRLNLAKQITSSVQWVDSVSAIVEGGVTNFIEIGPGKVLKGLLRRIDRNLKCSNIEHPEDIDSLSF